MSTMFLGFAAGAWHTGPQHRVFLAPLVFGTLLAVVSGGVRYATQPPLDLGAIDRFVAAQMARHGVPGLALAITHDDQVLYVQGYGEAREGKLVTADTQFLIASLSKSFTALAVMQLVEAGRIDLDASVQTYLPEFTLADPEMASQITVRYLLNHTSGLGDAGFPAMRLPQPATPAERVTSLRAARPVAQPGTAYQYDDLNYQILARLVEVASGESFSDYMQAHVFAPLEMGRTFSALTASEAVERADTLAQGHLNVYSFPVAVAEGSGFIAGSGGVVSTAADMGHYLIAQSSGGRFEGVALVSPESLALMHTPPPNLDSDYAMGWVETTQDGTRLLEHNGVFSTFYSEMVLLPESRYGMVLLYNIQSLAHVSVGFPQIKRGLTAILVGSQSPTGRLSVRTLELLFGLVTAAGVALALRSLICLPRWAEREPGTPLWRLVTGIVGKFVPGAFVLAMPTIVLWTSGRAFGYWALFRSMPEVMTWLGLTGALGAINGLARIVLLIRHRGRSARAAREG